MTLSVSHCDRVSGPFLLLMRNAHTCRCTESTLLKNGRHPTTTVVAKPRSANTPISRLGLSNDSAESMIPPCGCVARSAAHPLKMDSALPGSAAAAAAPFSSFPRLAMLLCLLENFPGRNPSASSVPSYHRWRHRSHAAARSSRSCVGRHAAHTGGVVVEARRRHLLPCVLPWPISRSDPERDSH